MSEDTTSLGVPQSPQAFIEAIAETEERLALLRTTRDEHIRQEHADGTSKYALARRWAITENTVTRILNR